MPRLTRDRGLRPTSRSSALVSIANSLASIANSLRIVVLREYRIDPDAPQPSRAESSLEVFEPMSADNVRDAIREEHERLEALEREIGLANTPPTAASSLLRMQVQRESAGEELSPEEQRFLAELDSETDER